MTNQPEKEGPGIQTEVDSRGVATVTLARPQRHNALSAGMMDDLSATFAQMGANPAVRVIVLTGQGRSFCAGGDLGWMRQQIGADAAARVREASRLAGMLQTINTCARPVIGRVQGNAFGGGVGLISVCDVAVGSEDVKLGLTETRLGLIPATIGPYVLARMGEAMARRIFMSSRVFDAAEAMRLGLLARVVGAADLDDAVEAEILPYLSAAPGAVAEAKALARRLGPRIDESVIAESIEALSRRWESDEAEEGIAAFFEKRPARWTEG